MPRSRIRGMAYLLPMELVEQIFSHLEDDRRSLCACALVHRAWVYSSQRCIFRTVAITSVYEWENLLRFLLAHPHIRPLICRLEWLLRGRHPGMGSSTILAVPKLFPRAQCLAFDAWITLCALSASFPALAVLEFHATSDRDDDLDGDLDRALTMHISKPFHSSPCCTWPLTMRSVFARDVIQVDSCPVEEWIRKNVRLDTLHSLSLSLPEIPDQPPFRHVLASLPALEDLTLCLEVPMKETGKRVHAPYPTSLR
jgi:hypothetical protein